MMPPIEHTAIEIQFRTSLCNELSLGISFAKFDQQGAENGCCRQSDRHFANLYIGKHPVATGWLQTICFINFFIYRRKVSNFSIMLLLGRLCQLTKNNLMKEVQTDFSE